MPPRRFQCQLGQTLWISLSLQSLSTWPGPFVLSININRAQCDLLLQAAVQSVAGLQAPCGTSLHSQASEVLRHCIASWGL